MPNTTLVTGLWDLSRESLTEGWSRSFDHYKANFRSLLLANSHNNMCIFIEPELEALVWECRDKSNTRIYIHKKDDFAGNFFPFFEKIQAIRQKEEWLNQAVWLRDSTQAKLEYYNPLVMSKMFLLHNASIYDPFNSDYFYWIDGGLTNTVHPGYFSHDNVIEKISTATNKFLFVCFPYEPNNEIHGFALDGMKAFCGSNEVNRVARGGFFGGRKEFMHLANDLYYGLLNSSLDQGLMGTEESIFTIMTYTDPDTYQYTYINNDGLLSTFFENAKNDKIVIENIAKINISKDYSNNDIILYINTFNTPKQLKLLLESFQHHDNRMISQTKLYLINNSTDLNTTAEYDELISLYNITEIRKNNIGVCGGRQFAAEHFKELGSKYMMFFEDDMLLDLNTTTCGFGFPKHIPDFFNNIFKIMDLEQYDFLKLTFSEFYGHNGEQWSWHNVPEPRKSEYFGNIKTRPLTNFTHIKTFNNIPYVEGEIFYSNWPQIVSQTGNKKMFLDTTWTYPYEQTWMSHMYTLTKDKILRPGLLLRSPITHNRVYFYEGSERKEN